VSVTRALCDVVPSHWAGKLALIEAARRKVEGCVPGDRELPSLQSTTLNVILVISYSFSGQIFIRLKSHCLMTVATIIDIKG
jgi:hypothetical protein